MLLCGDTLSAEADGPGSIIEVDGERHVRPGAAKERSSEVAHPDENSVRDGLSMTEGRGIFGRLQW